MNNAPQRVHLMTRSSSTRPRRDRVRVDEHRVAVRRLHCSRRYASPRFGLEGSEPLTPGPRSLARAPLSTSKPRARPSQPRPRRSPRGRSPRRPLRPVGHFWRAHPGQITRASKGFRLGAGAGPGNGAPKLGRHHFLGKPNLVVRVASRGGVFVRPWFRLGLVLVTFPLVWLLSNSAKTDQCTDGQYACDGGVVLMCVGQTWAPTMDCPGGSYCVAAVGGCALSPLPDPGCAALVHGIWGCSGTEYLICYGNAGATAVPATKVQCAQCTGTSCTGFVGDPCTSNADCVSSLECVGFLKDGGVMLVDGGAPDGGTCSAPCNPSVYYVPGSQANPCALPSGKNVATDDGGLEIIYGSPSATSTPACGSNGWCAP
jgi:hypothetical protein